MSKIIIVDDSFAIRVPLEFIIKEMGHEIFPFDDGKQALDFANHNSADLVITDLNMPVMDGMTLIENLRRLDSYRSIPVLVLTTESTDEKKKAARVAGATGWITKPFSEERIKKAINKSIS